MLRLLQRMTYVLAVAGLVMFIVSICHAAGREGVFHPFRLVLMLLALLPFVVLALAAAISRSPAAALTVLLGAAAVIGWGVHVYLRSVFADRPGSMVGLVFLFIPGYQAFGGVLVLVVAVVWREWSQQASAVDQP